MVGTWPVVMVIGNSVLNPRVPIGRLVTTRLSLFEVCQTFTSAVLSQKVIHPSPCHCSTKTKMLLAFYAYVEFSF